MTRTANYWQVSLCRIESTWIENEEGYEVEAVEAVCIPSGRRGEPAYGTSKASERRAAVNLNSTCRCGASFHRIKGTA